MKGWLRGKPGGLAAFFLIAGLVLGGLGWATAAALRLEREQLTERAAAEHATRLRLALWRLDGQVAPLLAREDGRPFNHYSALFAVPLAFTPNGDCWAPGSVIEPSPLLHVELPPWMLLHFQTSVDSGWESPQVPPPELAELLRGAQASLVNLTLEREQALADVEKALPPKRLLSLAHDRAAAATLKEKALLANREGNNDAQNLPGQPQQQAVNPQNFATPPLQQDRQNDYAMRSNYQSLLQGDRPPFRIVRDLALGNSAGNGREWFSERNALRVRGVETLVSLGPLRPFWVPTTGGERLLALRLVRIEDREICQGVLLDAEALQTQLAAVVADLFPEGQIVPMRAEDPPFPERTMTSLPFQLDPGPVLLPELGWTPLRVGLTLAWAAALLALAAVGLGGWSLLDLSERRIRFVSAVTHELRTPLTTLRLYLDMLLGGLVRDDQQREEYLRTLHNEADRLNRLVSNVLDFARLERPRSRRAPAAAAPAQLLAGMRETWQGRCHDADKELIVEDGLPPETVLWTDADLVQQVLGNLIDNACKYSRGAADRRLWLRARQEGRGVVFEVEDRGPGVAAGERRAIFRAFRRGHNADVTAGGVGLGLALARNWVQLLGGRLGLGPAPAQGGACFRLYLPLGNGPSVCRKQASGAA
jgi:signal transduction histidine kinase